MYICQNCKKVIDRMGPDTDGGMVDPMCPWCLRDSRYGPVGRLLRWVGLAIGVLALVALIIAILMKPAG
jgi:hypothetical protein